eukprot:scaffold2525_cov242-Prasinococcus_capsulatus_cf.AAC.1
MLSSTSTTTGSALRCAARRTRSLLSVRPPACEARAAPPRAVSTKVRAPIDRPTDQLPGPRPRR